MPGYLSAYSISSVTSTPEPYRLSLVRSIRYLTTSATAGAYHSVRTVATFAPALVVPLILNASNVPAGTSTRSKASTSQTLSWGRLWRPDGLGRWLSQ